jgi:hypothetical protein
MLDEARLPPPAIEVVPAFIARVKELRAQQA